MTEHLHKFVVVCPMVPRNHWEIALNFKRWLVLHAVVLACGAAMGLGSWYLKFSDYKAIKIIAIDRVELPNGKSDFVLDPFFLVEYVKSAGFASKVARRAGVDQLADALPSTTQGGRQNLGVRTLRGETSLEIRLSAPTAKEAKAIMDAVGAEIGELQGQRIDSVIEALTRSSRQQLKLASDGSTGFDAYLASRMSIDSALATVLMKNRSGLALETVVIAPGSPLFLMAMGAAGMLSLSLLLQWWRADTKKSAVASAGAEQNIQ
jgi:hypothetical protein